MVDVVETLEYAVAMLLATASCAMKSTNATKEEGHVETEASAIDFQTSASAPTTSPSLEAPAKNTTSVSNGFCKRRTLWPV